MNRRRKPKRRGKPVRKISSPRRKIGPIAPIEPSKFGANPKFWSNFVAATEATPQVDIRVTGFSGIQHQTLAVGLDEDRKRLVVVSPYHDAVASGMLSADLQAAHPDLKVVVARPVAFDLVGAIREIVRTSGLTELTADSLTDFGSLDEAARNRILEEHIGPVAIRIIQAFKIAPLRALSQFFYAAEEFVALGLPSLLNLQENDRRVDLTPVLATDTFIKDRTVGVCPIPLFDFSGSDYEAFDHDGAVDKARAVLTRHNVMQFFFPPADQVSLAVIEQGTAKPEVIGRGLEAANSLGHPISNNELIDSSIRHPHELLEALKDKGFVVEHETEVSISPQGQTYRQSIKLQPRESLIVRIVQALRIGVNINVD